MTTEPTPARGPGYGRLFAVPEFRAVFAAHAASLFGIVVAEISLSVLVYRISGSPLLSALTFALGFLPYAIGGTLLSGIADLYPPRRVLVLCDLLCAGCAALMAAPLTPVAGLLVLRMLIALVAPVINGTRMATLGDVLGEGDLFVLGRSLLRIVSQSALLVGFGLGGLLLTVVSPRHALLITVGTFLTSAVLLRFGTLHRPARTGQPGALVGDSLRGARQVLADRRVCVLLLLFWVPPMFAVVPEALAAPYADALDAGSTGLGLLMCALPVGTIAGELYAGSRLRPAVRERIALPLVCLTLLPYLGYALHPNLAVSFLLLLLSGAGSAYTLGLDQWFVRAVPEELRGRAMTVLTAGLMTIQGLGMTLGGVAADFVPAHTVTAVAGVAGTVCAIAVVVSVRRRRPAPAGSSAASPAGVPESETELTGM
ncbi:MAG: MFS transporter [Kitasatospora sp.]|jgi:MFS family permease|nr:MFS transporter [Kitasatospora sp.]